MQMSLLQRASYFLDPINYLQWSMYVCCLVFVIPTSLCEFSWSYQWSCGIFAIFLSWIYFLLLFQKLDSVGLFVVMFLQILKTVFQVMAVFSFLFVAFGLAFYILLNREGTGGYKYPTLSIIHTLVMMMGDWNFSNVFVRPIAEKALPYPNLTFVFLLMFILIMPILFANLLIGLAVGDIEMVQRHAALKRLAMQVDYHTEMEEMIPLWFLQKFSKTSITIYPNKKMRQGFVPKMCNLLVSLFGMNLKRSTEGRGKPKKRESSTGGHKMDIICRKQSHMESEISKLHELVRLIGLKLEITQEADVAEEDGSRGEQEEKRGSGFEEEEEELFEVQQAEKREAKRWTTRLATLRALV